MKTSDNIFCVKFMKLEIGLLSKVCIFHRSPFNATIYGQGMLTILPIQATEVSRKRISSEENDRIKTEATMTITIKMPI